MKYFPPPGNAGPHDPELVQLILDCLSDAETGRPYLLVRDLYEDTDFLNLLVDNINDVFSPELDSD